MDTRALRNALDVLNRTPHLLQQLCSGLTRQQQTWKPSTAEFSVVENICHLRDIEAEGYAIRIERILTEVEPELADLEGSRLAVERSYNSSDLASALDQFSIARERSLALVRGAEPYSFDRRGRLEGIGSVTLAELLGRIVEHDRSHIEELRGLRARLP